MAYLTQEQLNALGFKHLGKNVKISDRAVIYNAEEISIGDFSRVDDFCMLSGLVSIGRYCHLTPYCMIAGGSPGVELADFCTLAYGVRIFSQSDDYSGETMVNSLIPKKFKNELFAAVKIERQVIIGTSSVIMPGVMIRQGCSVGAMSLVTKSTEEWGIYVGSPARRIKDRSKNLLKLEQQFLDESSDSL